MSSQLFQVQFNKLLLTDKEEGNQHQNEVTVWKQKLAWLTDKEAWRTKSYQDQRSHWQSCQCQPKHYARQASAVQASIGQVHVSQTNHKPSKIIIIFHKHI